MFHSSQNQNSWVLCCRFGCLCDRRSIFQVSEGIDEISLGFSNYHVLDVLTSIGRIGLCVGALFQIGFRSLIAS
jgi:hypothetical protein